MGWSGFALAVWLGCLLSGFESFRSFSQFRRVPSRYEVSSGFATDFEKLSAICQEVAVPMNTTATLINLIQYGDIWAADSKKVSSGEFDRFKKGEKVSGCMADVRITTTFSYPELSESGMVFLPRISIDGTADSRVAQGILALLCQGLNDLECSAVLTLSSTELSEECGLNTLLPRGRLNGLHNMVTLIQNQINRELQRVKNSETSSVLGSDGDKIIFNTLPRDLFKSDYNTELEGRDTSDEVAVLLSGGVDSSVALKLLQLRGHKVRAFYLKIWLEDEVAHLNECPWEEDLGYAESVCAQLGVPLETLSLQKEYWQEVVQYTFREAKAGRTPNPDILCNSRIKFGMFYEYVGKYYSKIATGHYAQVLYGDDNVDSCSRLMVAEALEREVEASLPSAVIEIGEDDDDNNLTKVLREEFETSRIKESSPSYMLSEDQLESQYTVRGGEESKHARLVMSPDGIKDQTYFLSALSQEQLAKAIFPIGHLRKKDVRVLADEYQLPTRARKDSQGICFLGKLKFDEFIEHYLGENEGVIRCYQTGRILGQHRGLWFHTIGQRKGLGPHLQSVVHDGPWYVAGKEAESNTLFVTNNLSLVDRPRVEFRVHKINWVAGCPPSGLSGPGGLVMDLKLRHGPTLSRGTVTISKDASGLVGMLTQGVVGGVAEDVGEGEGGREGGEGEGVEGEGSTGGGDSILQVILDKKDKGIAPGQFAAFYHGAECLGSGVIVDTAVDEISRQEEHINLSMKSKAVNREKSEPTPRSLEL